jgi:5-methylcytosine-specific restriction endonuclease McrA
MGINLYSCLSELFLDVSMNWEEAIRRYLEYEATHLGDTQKSAEEKLTIMENDVRYLLGRMPDLSTREIEEITPAIWMSTLSNFKKNNRDHMRNWDDLFNWQKYKHLRACLVYAKSDYQCHYCGRDLSSKRIVFHVEHLKPRVSGGTEELDNLRCLCQFCNLAKGQHSEEEFLEELKDVCASVQRRFRLLKNVEPK